jgi:hypothetical protein
MGNVVNRVRNITVEDDCAPSARVNDSRWFTTRPSRFQSLRAAMPVRLFCRLKEKRRPFDHVHDD